jgi:hypothetical protein
MDNLNVLEEKFSEFADQLDDASQERFQKFIDKQDADDKCIKKIKTYLKAVLYTGRNMIKKET